MIITKTSTDFSTSVEKALAEIDPHFQSYEGIIVTGSHAPQEVEEKISLIRKARHEGIPFLGICMGMQLAAIEWVRDIAKLERANSTEIDKDTPNPVVVRMSERHTGIRPVSWFDGTTTYESHWHQYALNPYYLRYFPQELWDVSLGGHAVEMLRYKPHPFFWTVQFHPEYQNATDKPHKLLVEFLKSAKSQTQKYAVRM